MSVSTASFTHRKGRATRAPIIVPLIVLAALLPGCGKKKVRPPVAPAPAVGVTEVGIASWYGHPYHGRRAANGEIYDMEKLTAAHRTLSFGTWVRVRNLSNGKTVEVRINDRGPFVRGRIIDLSRVAARRIEMIGPGTARVRLQVIAEPAEQAASERYAVQAGAFRNLDNARRLRDAMQRRYGFAQLVRRDGEPPMWRVLVGEEPFFDVAAALAERMRAELGPAFVVRLDQAGQPPRP
jgi:rare lipoprotein A